MAFAWEVAEAEVFRAGDSVVQVWNPAPCVLITRVVGPGTSVALGFYTARAEREMARGRISVFHDWSAMSRYDPEARETIKRWGRAHNDGFVRVLYLVRSKVVVMLISVAALTLGRDLQATTDRAHFLREIERDLRR